MITQADIFKDFKENHGEVPSIASENRRRPNRFTKANVVLRIMKFEECSGQTAGEMWWYQQNRLKASKIKDIYDFRRVLSMLKKSEAIYSGKPRECKLMGVNTFPWYLK